MKLALVLLLALSVTLVAAPAAEAAPPEVCEDVLGEPKCEQVREEVRDLLTCTCPPW